MTNIIVSNKIRNLNVGNSKNQLCYVTRTTKHNIILPSKLEVKPFHYRNTLYYMDVNTKYVFIPKEYDQSIIRPVGKFINDTQHENNHLFLSNKRIEWYIVYDYDTTAQ